MKTFKILNSIDVIDDYENEKNFHGWMEIF